MFGSSLKKYRETFRAEADEILNGLDLALINAEKNPDDTALIDRIFRGFHSIKGSGAMFGCDRIAGMVHTLESVFDRIRSGLIELTPSVTDLSLKACDHVRGLLRHQEFGESDPEYLPENSLLCELENLLPDSESVSASKPADPHHDKTLNSTRVYQIRFHPDPSVLRSGINPVLLLGELCSLGAYEIVADTSRIPDFEKLEPDLCLTEWYILLRTTRDENTLRDIFIFVEGNCSLTIEDLGDAYTDAAFAWLARQFRMRHPLSGELIETAKELSREEEKKSASESNDADGFNRTRQMRTESESVRVSSEKLDTLVNLLGELVILQAGLKRRAENLIDPELMSLAERIERLTWDLRDTGMGMRLLPVGVLFSRFHRLVRDLSKSKNKQVALFIHGEETELDKSLIEHLNDPLMHLIRNCIDHGIEPAEERKEKGKPAAGRISLSAEQSGFDILITVADDGAGLDTAAIRKRAFAKGLLGTKKQYSDAELEPLIFMPGFSSRETVSDVSGRGVGMDVVKSNLESLGGSVTLSSQKHHGLTVTLRVPLTLGIIEGLIVSIDHESFVFPLSSVDECVELIHQNGNHRKGRQLLNIRDQAVPYIRLRDHFGFQTGPPEIEEVLITRNNGRTVGFVVDHIIGNQQIVIKPLGRMYRDIKGLSGATILGNGTVGLILDIANLAEQALRNGNTN